MLRMRMNQTAARTLLDFYKQSKHKGQHQPPEHAKPHIADAVQRVGAVASFQRRLRYSRLYRRRCTSLICVSLQRVCPWFALLPLSIVSSLSCHLVCPLPRPRRSFSILPHVARCVRLLCARPHYECPDFPIVLASGDL